MEKTKFEITSSIWQKPSWCWTQTVPGFSERLKAPKMETSTEKVANAAPYQRHQTHSPHLLASSSHFLLAASTSCSLQPCSVNLWWHHCAVEPADGNMINSHFPFLFLFLKIDFKCFWWLEGNRTSGSAAPSPQHDTTSGTGDPVHWVQVLSAGSGSWCRTSSRFLRFLLRLYKNSFRKIRLFFNSMISWDYETFPKLQREEIFRTWSLEEGCAM